MENVAELAVSLTLLFGKDQPPGKLDDPFLNKEFLERWAAELGVEEQLEESFAAAHET